MLACHLNDIASFILLNTTTLNKNHKKPCSISTTATDAKQTSKSVISFQPSFPRTIFG